MVGIIITVSIFVLMLLCAFFYLMFGKHEGKSTAEQMENAHKAWDKVKSEILFFLKTEYQIVQYENQLTEEIYHFIEYRKYWWWFEYNPNAKYKWYLWLVLPEKKYRLHVRQTLTKNIVNQQKFGYDHDGMFGDIKNAITIMKYLRGDTKLIRKVRTDIQL